MLLAFYTARRPRVPLDGGSLEEAVARRAGCHTPQGGGRPRLRPVSVVAGKYGLSQLTGMPAEIQRMV